LTFLKTGSNLVMMRSAGRFPRCDPLHFLCVAFHFGLAYPNRPLDERDQNSQIQQLIQDHDLAEASRKILEAAKQYPADAGLDQFAGHRQAQQGKYAARGKEFQPGSEEGAEIHGCFLEFGRLIKRTFASDAQARRKALGVYLGVLATTPRTRKRIIRVRRCCWNKAITRIRSIAFRGFGRKPNGSAGIVHRVRGLRWIAIENGRTLQRRACSLTQFFRRPDAQQAFWLRKQGTRRPV